VTFLLLCLHGAFTITVTVLYSEMTVTNVLQTPQMDGLIQEYNTGYISEFYVGRTCPVGYESISDT
jgi:hypothetical protein